MMFQDESENRKCGFAFAFGVILAAGIVGYALYESAKMIVYGRKTIKVHGVAEKMIDSNTGLFTIYCKATDVSLSATEAKLRQSIADIKRFLTDMKVRPDEITIEMDEMRDDYKHKENTNNPSYSKTACLTVNSNDVKYISQLYEQALDILPRQQSFVLGRINKPRYDYVGVGDIKADMLAQATRNAQETAEKTASSSGKTLGQLLNTRIGSVSIGRYDQFDQITKTVKLVITSEYELK